MIKIPTAISVIRSYSEIHCPKCFSTKLKSISHLGRGKKSGYNYFKCKDCSTICKVEWVN